MGQRGFSRWPGQLPCFRCNVRPWFGPGSDGGTRGCFEIRTTFQLETAVVASGLIRHLAIRSDSRQRCPLPEALDLWLEASSLGEVSSL